MKMYTKPSVNVIELAIEENIAAIVPKTIYKKKSGVSGSGATYQKTGYDANFSIATTGFEA